MAGGNGVDDGNAAVLALKARKQAAQQQLCEAMVARDCEDIDPLRVALERAAEAGLESEGIIAGRQVLTTLEAAHQPLAFTDVPRPAMEQLQLAGSREEVLAVLMRCMGLSIDAGLQSEILAEYHYHNFMFCQKHRFCSEKASAFLSIMKRLHMSAFVEEKLSEDQARELFESLMKRHSRQLPPFSVDTLTPDEVLVAKEFASRSFFRHYSMYSYAYSRRSDLEVRTLTESVIPAVADVAELHVSFEIDPREVPELADLFLDPEIGTVEVQARAAENVAAAISTSIGASGGGSAAAATTLKSQGLLGSSAPSPAAAAAELGGQHRTEVHAALEDALKAHDLDSLCALPE